MDTKKLVVGQEVYLFGVGRVLGKVVSVFPSLAVQSDDVGVLQFDENGKETDSSRKLRCGAVLEGPCPSFQPWELESVDEVHFASNVTSWLIKFLQSGEKPADEIFREAEKKFGDAAGDAVDRASRTLFVWKRQENRHWYWSLRKGCTY
jgi:hypothetical protein